MRNVAILGIVCLGTLGMMSGCSDGASGTTGGAGGTGGSDASSSSSSSSVTGSSTSSSSSSGMGGAGGGGGGGMPLINGCDQATAENHLADAKVTISVGANGFTFSPACVRMKKGAQINFVGAFASHPLVGGVIGPPPVPDSSSPIKPTNSGNSATFTIPLAGTYPFYCEYHQPTMAGAAFVE